MLLTIVRCWNHCDIINNSCQVSKSLNHDNDKDGKVLSLSELLDRFKIKYFEEFI